VLGDASESALLKWADSLTPIAELRGSFPKLHEVPFSSLTKVALVVARDPERPGVHLVLCKGAPEVVITRCTHVLHNGRPRLLDADWHTDFTAGGCVVLTWLCRGGCMRARRVLCLISFAPPARTPPQPTSALPWRASECSALLPAS